MIALTGTNLLEALMSGAAATTNPSFYVSYGVTDSLKDFDGVTPNSGSLNDTTPVTLVPAPTGGNLRHDVRDIVIHNSDTQLNTVTLRVDVSTTKFIVWTGDIPIGGFARLENSTGRIVIYNSVGEETSSTTGLVLHANTHQHGGSDEVATASPAANAIPKADGTGKLPDGWIAESSVTQHEAAIDHDALSNFVLGEHRLLDDAQITATTLWSSQKIQSELTTSADVVNAFAADQLDTPSGTDWAVNVHAPAEQDDNDNSLVVRAFDDTTEEGVGLSLIIPTGATEIMFRFKGRARTAPGVVNTVGLKVYCRSFPDNASPGAWSGGTTLTDIDIPTNENFQYDSQTFTLAELGLSVGTLYQFEITRVAPGGGTDLTGDWLLSLLQVEFNVDSFTTSTLLSADLLFPTSSDWTVQAHAAEAADSNNDALVVRRFDDTVEEGVGILLLIPTTATQMKIKFKSRAEATPGGAVSVLPRIYTMEFPDNTAPTAWSNGLDMTLLAFPTNENFQYDEQTLTLASLNLAAGRIALMEITRNSPDGSDDLNGDWALASIQIELM